MRKDLELDNIFIPSKIPSKKLMIVLHGRGDSSEGFEGLPQFLELEDMNYIIFDAPFEYYGGFSWYNLPPNQFPGIQYSSELLTKCLDSLFEEEFDPTQSYLFGFSQGSLLTFEFGARYHKVLAGYIAISGYIYDVEHLLEEMNPDVKQAKWLCTNGTHDEVLPFEESKKQVEQLIDAGFEVDFRAIEKDHSIHKDEIIIVKQLCDKNL
ncbi:MAG: serine esterase [Campylobacterales bacterium]|nr:serine esterase [Campylobacterales bacterium]